MTNFEQLMNDREKLIDALAGNEEFMMNEVESGWCGGCLSTQGSMQRSSRVPSVLDIYVRHVKLVV